MGITAGSNRCSSSVIVTGSPATARPRLAASTERTRAASIYLSVSLSHLYGLIRAGELQKIKLGARAAGIRRSDLDAWLNTQATR